MDTFLEKYNVLKLNEEEAQSLNRPVMPEEIETVIKKLPTHKSPGPDGLSLIHISEPTRPGTVSRMPSSA